LTAAAAAQHHHNNTMAYMNMIRRGADLEMRYASQSRGADPRSGAY
jgi:hypothetical protein